MASSAVIDACAFHEWASTHALTQYMSPGWRTVIMREGDMSGPMPVMASRMYRSPMLSKSSSAAPAEGATGSNFELFKEQLLDRDGRERVVIGYDDGMLATAMPLPYLAREVTRAANDYTINEWLERDPRVYGQILVTTQLPDEAAAEIRRVGSHPQMVAVALGTNGLGRPFGHPAYHVIFEAAAELDLPLVIQHGSDATGNLPGPPMSGGPAATYSEYMALDAVPMMSHSLSMIMGGVFDRFPGLEVLLVGGGAAWLPSILWRGDYHYQLMPMIEAPWMHGTLPSTYFLRHFKISTWGLEAPRNPGQLEAVLKVMPGIERMLMYTSCYPNTDSEIPQDTAARLPTAWARRVLHDNAEEFFRWPDRPRREAEREAASIEELQAHAV